MAKRTAMPTVYIEELSLEVPPYDEPGVVQEYVGEKWFLEYDFLQSAEDITQDTIIGFIKDLDESSRHFRPLVDEETNTITDSAQFKLGYDFIISTLPPRGERRAKAKARAFVRAKNPFEPSQVNIKSVERNKSLERAGEKPADVNIWSVSATVEK